MKNQQENDLISRAALAEGVQVLAMLKKFRCLLESEGNDNEMRTL